LAERRDAVLRGSGAGATASAGGRVSQVANGDGRWPAPGSPRGGHRRPPRARGPTGLYGADEGPPSLSSTSKLNVLI
jgi:hypothetical protein